jgi:HK97 gp10 family phage protein
MAQSFNHLPQLQEAIRRAAGQLVRKAAFDIQAHAQDRAPVQSGHLKSSIYTVTNAQAGSDNGYGQGVTGDGELLPPVAPPSVDGPAAVVAPAADYAVYVELGTRHMPAQPYLTPAAEAVRGPFVAAFSRLEDKLRDVGGGG